jgi:hypothetical protein
MPFGGGDMTTGTIIMIVCLALLGLLRIFFKKDMDVNDKKYSVYNDPDFEGLDGCGIIGHSVEDLNKELYGDK